LDTEFGQGILDIFQTKRFNNGFYFFHGNGVLLPRRARQ
jgi:hypothetical protein